MSIYTQQINNMVERLPIADQQFIIEFIKRISKNNSSETNETPNKPVPLKQAISRFIEGINSTPPLEDDVIDEILYNRVDITRDLGDI